MKLVVLLSLIISVITFGLVGCSLTELQRSQEVVNSHQLFAQDDTFLSNQKNLRKWDAPTIADLDQDGYPDLLLNDHGFSVKIIWNNQGEFDEPFDLIMGDMHGISVADFNTDGKLEVILARGGGSGSNARNSVIFQIDKQRNIVQLADFDEPLAMMRGRTVKFVDLDKDGDSDLINFAFPSQEKQGASENYLYENDQGKTLLLKNTLPASIQNGQKLLLTDTNNDGYVDIFMYGQGSAKLYRGGPNFMFEFASEQILPPNIRDVTGAVEIDFDNDGDFDLFLTRGKEFEAGQTFYNEPTKTFGFYTKRGKFDFLLEGVGDILSLENIQSQWPNKNIYIGESGYDYVFPGETHSGRDIRLVNSDALGFPQTRDKKGTYIGYVGNQNWRIAGDIFSPFTGIVHGVESQPIAPPDNGLTNLLLINNKGAFTDGTKNANLMLLEHSMGVAVGDLNNDGYEDLVVVKRGDLVNQNSAILYFNMGDGRFEEVTDHGVVTTELGAIGMAVDIFDYNRDGQRDILIGNERGKWHLFENQSKQTSFVTIQVGKSPANQASPLGARIQLNSCNGTQLKTVGSTGAAYSLNYVTNIQFGLGDCADEGAVKVLWSNGEQQSIKLRDESLYKVGNFVN
ncbi:VCBS repeat-containing protein [Aliiglaciecola sp. 3_MG-2023]|uniref:FG-GAP repeat domain-containing protein n=1 Tax=Aliiglaciecola TaxID=1406885 RepID=UPI001C0A6635|nr:MULTISPECIES: VCBS repeat-containing protein [Aliiglaciecola]MBU2878959.1 VCBS repeat-containing protein [Aliiglaciecola lipolytica]MDO6693150.1 VCBS repeat-containing protein [Aliiglaciecola sp. 3_MG-2023]MDO6710660.1 VCBS repeat-containing protein [Aliiglaciecola sp. 2_MG-2023]MDO6751932.1 VCBS repeat-containing protein [Aliiglaciecola sp. 1_MG-2023]